MSDNEAKENFLESLREKNTSGWVRSYPSSTCIFHANPDSDSTGKRIRIPQ